MANGPADNIYIVPTDDNRERDTYTTLKITPGEWDAENWI